MAVWPMVLIFMISVTKMLVLTAGNLPSDMELIKLCHKSMISVRQMLVSIGVDNPLNGMD